MKRHIEVVAAIIIKEGKIFAACRSYGNKETIDKFEFPGGKVEADETHQMALTREIKEEFSASIEVQSHFMDVDYEYDDFTMTLHAYFALLTSHELVPQEHSSIFWGRASELSKLAFGPADSIIVKALQNKNLAAIGGK
ncbi:MAG TPA: (deoxy)nucleoside triphosphate pyrophosphohydrolase [Bacilli bacterium]|nr:(deoxy)nucleoside triphosphate pyrophosphohydrolase [Bacilli bacterium]